MTIEMARNVHAFLMTNGIDHINLMGEEIACHPEWRTIFPILAEGLHEVRVVTNGDWVDIAPDFAQVVSDLYDVIPHDGKSHPYISLSKNR